MYTSLRWGEILGLQRGDLNLAEGTVRIRRAVAETNGQLYIKTPKTAAGARTVAYLFLVRGDTWPRDNFSRLWHKH